VCVGVCVCGVCVIEGVRESCVRVYEFCVCWFVNVYVWCVCDCGCVWVVCACVGVCWFVCECVV